MVAGEVEIMADAPREPLTAGNDLRHLMQQIVDLLQRFAVNRVHSVSVEEGAREYGLEVRQPRALLLLGDALEQLLMSLLVRGWPERALVGSFELLVILIRTGRGTRAGDVEREPHYQVAPPLAHQGPLELPVAPTLEHNRPRVYEAGWLGRVHVAPLGLKWPHPAPNRTPSMSA